MSDTRTPAEALTTLAEAREVFFKNAGDCDGREEKATEARTVEKEGSLRERKAIPHALREATSRLRVPDHLRACRRSHTRLETSNVRALST